jgi:hypothetical protein
MPGNGSMQKLHSLQQWLSLLTPNYLLSLKTSYLNRLKLNCSNSLRKTKLLLIITPTTPIKPVLFIRKGCSFLPLHLEKPDNTITKNLIGVQHVGKEKAMGFSS